MNRLIFSFFILSASLTYAATDKTLAVVGYVVGYDDEQITIENDGLHLKYPRSKYKKKVSVGERIEIALNESEFKKSIKKAHAKSKKKN